MASGLLHTRSMAPIRAREEGFTLIELLVVVAIIGILAAVAVPQFAGRQGVAYDKRVQSDCRLAAVSQEAYFVDHLTYASNCAALPAFTISEGVTFTDCTGDDATFRVETDHPNANQRCSWDSSAVPSLVCVPK